MSPAMCIRGGVKRLALGVSYSVRTFRHSNLHPPPSSSTSPLSPAPLSPWMDVLGRRLKSSAAVLKIVGQQEGEREGLREGGGQEEDGLSGGGGKRQPEKVVIQGTSHTKPLRIPETPVLHHRKAKAVVELSRGGENAATPPTTPPSSTTATHTTPEIHTSVEQLLRETANSIQISKHNKSSSSTTTEHTGSWEASDKPGSGVLVGALPAGALDWRPQHLDVTKLGHYYADLAKSRLTGLVVLTAVGGYAMAPAPLDPITLVLAALGTGLVSSSANAINQFLEVPFDSQMSRTQSRILVRGLVSPLHAVTFALVCGGAGVSMLYWGANGLAAALGALNLILYTGVYTPAKRLTILNTWLGAVVGAIPPLIGWSACVGELGVGAWLMAAVLFSWQFPHFNALSWNLRADYSRAGYRMMSVTDPDLCRRVTLRHSLAMVGICTLAPALDVTTWTFAADSLPFNGYLVYLSWKFYQDADSNSSRKLFMFSLIHLPVIMMLMIISKKHYGRTKTAEGGEASVVTVESGTKHHTPVTSGS